MIGEGYDRRLDGSLRKPNGPRPVVAIREGNYVLRGWQTEKFTIPTEFTLVDVVNDPEEQQELSKVKPDIYQRLKQKLIDKYQEVNTERLKTASDVEQKVSQLPE